MGLDEFSEAPYDQGEQDTIADQPAQADTHSRSIEALYNRYFTRLLTNLRRKFGPGPPDPGDIAQQVFLKLAERGRLDDVRQQENFAWIIACNLMFKERRKLTARTQHVAHEDAEANNGVLNELDPERVLESRQSLDIVSAKLAEMPERRRTIFLLNRVDGLTPQQAGARCGVSRSSAVRHIAIATQILTNALAEAAMGDQTT
ncbi:MAG: sigma-70 family RNA polymerase sigma factor [Pseudomonadota bacterium]